MQIYPNTPRKGSKRISRKVDFNILRDPNIPLGLKNCGENVCFFISVIQVLYSLSILININQLQLPVKGVAMKIKTFQGNRDFKCAVEDVCL